MEIRFKGLLHFLTFAILISIFFFLSHAALLVTKHHARALLPQCALSPALSDSPMIFGAAALATAHPSLSPRSFTAKAPPQVRVQAFVFEMKEYFLALTSE